MLHWQVEAAHLTNADNHDFCKKKLQNVILYSGLHLIQNDVFKAYWTLLVT